MLMLYTIFMYFPYCMQQMHTMVIIHLKRLTHPLKYDIFHISFSHSHSCSIFLSFFLLEILFYSFLRQKESHSNVWNNTLLRFQWIWNATSSSLYFKQNVKLIDFFLSLFKMQYNANSYKCTLIMNLNTLLFKKCIQKLI